MSESTDRELAVFAEAVKVPAEERVAFLERTCGGDEDLRRKVEALLKAHDRVGNFLEEPPPGGLAE